MADASPTSTTSTSPSSNASPLSSPNFPAKGDAFHTREQLSSLIKSNGKALGYIFKCSVTSEHRVTYYCSNKYHAPKCLAGFKAAFARNQGWIVTEATEHNEGCTKLRQRVNGVKVEGHLLDSISAKPASPVVSKSHTKSKSSTSTGTTITSSPSSHKRGHTTRKNASGLRTSITESYSTNATRKGNGNDSCNTSITRKQRTYSTSTAANTSASPPSSSAGKRRGSLTQGRRTLKEVDENADARIENVHPSFSWNASNAHHHSGAPSKGENSRHNEESGNGGGGGGRDRSHSSSSSQSARSERSSYVTTILDPEFHFPPATLEASVELQKVLPCRRKRSSSYVRNSAFLLGRYLDSQKSDIKEVKRGNVTVAGDVAMME